MTSKKRRIVVLGAGCAGLAAGWRLLEKGFDVVLIEQDDHVGGLAGGIQINGNTYEFGPHIFHTTDPEIRRMIITLMGDALIPYHRTIQIKFLGRYFQFPLSMRDVFFKLPPLTVVHALFSFVYHWAKGLLSRPTIESSETVLQRYYGNVLYEIFFKSYIERVWGLTPAQMSPAFARQRIPRMNLLEELEKLLLRLKPRLQGGAQQTDGYVEKLEGDLYTTRQGFSLIAQNMAQHLTERGGRIHLDARVRRLIKTNGAIGAVEYEHDSRIEQLECDGVINTLPINDAVRMIDPPLGASERDSADALQFRALVFVGLLVKRSRILPASFMYFREHSFNRISDLSYFNFDIQPDGCTLLVAEITCQPEDRPWTDDAYAEQEVIADLVREKLLERSEIVETHVFRTPHAYPIYKLGYEVHLEKLLCALEAHPTMETAGRQGRFQYVNTHVVMKMAFDAVDRLEKKLTLGSAAGQTCLIP